MSEALAEVRRFVALQRRLMLALLIAEGDVPSEDGGSLAPTGVLELEDGRWSYRRHGGGVAFRHVASGRYVNVHDRPDRPDWFDAWRLRSYFGSLRGRGGKILQRETGAVGRPMDASISELLLGWLDAGSIEQVTGEPDMYRLSISIVEPAGSLQATE